MSFRMMMASGASHDQQVREALDCLESHHPQVYASIAAKFPEVDNWKWENSASRAWIDTDAMGVDPEFTSWLADELESTDVVEWRDGDLWVWFSGP